MKKIISILSLSLIFSFTSLSGIIFAVEEINISYNCKKESGDDKSDDSLDLLEMADDSSDKEICDKVKLSEITTYIDKEFIFSL